MKFVNLAETESAPLGLWRIEPELHSDERGFFYESFRADKFRAAIGDAVNFVQDNHARSEKGVARGLHYQRAPHAQEKLVRVVSGAVYDIALDIRVESKSFGQWYGLLLSEQNRYQLRIPVGFAHGYIALTDNCELLYKTSDIYAPECEGSIYFSDTALNISLPPHYACEYDIKTLRLSAKDRRAPTLKEVKTHLHN